jgi:hypothetical protein
MGGPGAPQFAPRNLGGAAAPRASATPASAGGQPQSQPTNAMTTDRGTVVPLPQGNQRIEMGTIPFKAQVENSQKTEQAWAAVQPALETARTRLELTASIFKDLEGKGLNEQKAIAANALRGIPGGSVVADAIMGAKDTAGVQTAVWNSVQEALSSLKAINAGTGGRILNAEFNQYVDHGLSPDLSPQALHSATTQLLGAVYQTQNMIGDYNSVAKQNGWRDANQFQSAYLQRNPLEGFVKYASDEIGPFKGMPVQIDRDAAIKELQRRGVIR